MPPSQNSVQLSAKIGLAKTLLKNIESHIQNGKDQEADMLSGQYEIAIDDILNFKSQTAQGYIMKLNFSRGLVKVDHPVDDIIDRIFISLQNDFTQIIESKA